MGGGAIAQGGIIMLGSVTTPYVSEPIGDIRASFVKYFGNILECLGKKLTPSTALLYGDPKA